MNNASPFRRRLLHTAILAAPLLLAACGGDDNDRRLAELDDRLTTGAPATGSPLDQKIVVDATRTSAAEAKVAVGAEELDGQPLLSAPQPAQMAEADCTQCTANGPTLGDKAAQQSGGRGKGTCEAKLTYTMAWTKRMPPEFPVYPGARVSEAAGVDGGLCDLRTISFVTDARMKSVVDYYYSRARRSGYSAEYVLRGGDHVLGGTRDADDGAYVLFLRPTPNGGTEGELVASNGR